MILQTIKYKDLENWSVKSLIRKGIKYNPNYPLVKLGDILIRNKTQIEIQDDIEYKRVTIKLYNGGIYLRDKKLGKDIGTKKQFLIKKGQFLLSKIDARNGAFGIVPDELDGAIITGNFWTYDVDYSKVNPLYLTLITTTKQFVELCNNASSGTTRRHYLQEDIFLNTKIPLPDVNIQKQLIEKYQKIKKRLDELKKEYPKLLEQFEKEIFIVEKQERKSLLKKIRYKDLESWSVTILIDDDISSKYPLKPFKEVLSKANVEKINIEDNKKYKILGVRSYGKGVYINREVFGKDLKMKKYQVAKRNHLYWCKVDTKNGAFGIITEEFENSIASSNMTFAKINYSKIDLYYLQLLFQLKKFNQYMDSKVTGTTNRKYIKFDELLHNIKVPLPDINTQKQLIVLLKNNLEEQKRLEKELEVALKEFENEIFS